jgi:peroxiredoxin
MRHFIPALLGLALLAPMAAAREAGARVERRAETVLRAMEKFYRSTRTLTAHVSCATTIVTAGDKQDLFCAYDARLARPNKLAIIPGKCSPGTMAPTVISDGKTGVSAYMDFNKRHTLRPAAESLDDVFKSEDIALVNRTLAGMFLLNQLMQSSPYETLLRHVLEVKYVGEELLDGRKTDHLSFIEKDVTWELWVDQGAAPLPRKAVPDVSKLMDPASGMKTTVLVEFSGWTTDAPIADELFHFAIPQDSLLIDSFYETDDDWRNRLLGKAPPATKLKLSDGSEHDLAADKGSIVMLDFWSIWCAPCCRQLPALTELAAEYKDRHVVLYTVHENNDLEAMRAFLKKQNLAPPVALDDKRELATKYRVIGIPQTVLIGKDGSVQAIHVGGNPQFKAELKAQLDALLAGRKLAK